MGRLRCRCAAVVLMPEVELLWFADCPNHPAARRMLEQVISEIAP